MEAREIHDQFYKEFKSQKEHTIYSDWLESKLHALQPKWIEILADGSNLPSESGDYWVSLKDTDERHAYWAAHKRRFVTVDEDLYLHDVTHYLPISKPEAPNTKQREQ